MKAASILYVLIICCSTWYAESKPFPGLFFPEDIQTILNLAYSRLPPVKLGSDKRFGVGFRLGNNADFQVLVELGPQSETAPLRDQTNSFRKRESHHKKYYHREKPKAVDSKNGNNRSTTKQSSQYKTEHPFSTSTTMEKSSHPLKIDPSSLNSTNKKSSHYKTESPKSYSSTTQKSSHGNMKSPPLNSATLKKLTNFNTELPYINSKTNNKMTPLSLNSVSTTEAQSKTEKEFYKYTNSKTPINNYKSSNKTQIQFKTTNKPVISNFTHKKPESLFGMFINWLTEIKIPN